MIILRGSSRSTEATQSAIYSRFFYPLVVVLMSNSATTEARNKFIEAKEKQ